MQSYFKSAPNVATSSRSENHFGDIKDSILDNRRPIRIDKFLIKHFIYIDSSIKLGWAAFHQTKLINNIDIFKKNSDTKLIENNEQ